ncbi:ABC-type multidrug transport system, ATpase and permease component [Clostridium aceticum]|uniref:ABC-type multidrug transport system, ATpase and permease component n=1 Tax=Clostridium aceticum TaxID=84022 RepID=A0A0D8IBZ1_9CLOT|nr:ABC transporter ATP-binding protein [Clostridium aceticum]AKL94897.1 ABC-type multidrug transport system, ATpase and permease component [Clostridium aceticum]KJF27820.1 multidrug ABC transporter ATPase [Clostridium aceticum]
MKNFHRFNEATAGKTYDSKLMARLLKYAKDYWLLLTTSVLLLTLIAGIDIARPYIIKIAIDDYMRVYDRPITEYENTIDFAFIPSSALQLVRYEGTSYLINGTFNSNDTNYKIDKIDHLYQLVTDNEIFEAQSLSAEEVRSFRRNDVHALGLLSILYFLLISLGVLFNYIQVYLLNYTSNKIVLKIRNQLFAHLQKMPLSFFDTNSVGQLVTRVTNDTETLHEMYTGVLVNLFKDIFVLCGIIFIMLKMNISLALLSFSVVPIILISAGFFRTKVRIIYREVRTKLGAVNALLNANFSGIKTIHVFNREDQQFKEFDKNNQELLIAHKKQNFIFAIFRPSMEVIHSLGIAIILWYGGGQVLRQSIEFGVLFAFINYMKQFFQPINDLTEKYNILQSAMASSERIFALLDEEPAIKDTESVIKGHSFLGEIEFRNVWFAYHDEDWVLKDISFKIHPGESIAFVGATGAGKSSIIQLIGRFYDIQKGEILIDGMNIKSIPLKDLRENIGILLQEVFMFTGTIKDNIVLNNKNFTEEEIIKVAKYVNVHNFIEKLPKKYDEPVVEKGNNFSTGQRQLLAFARALIFNPSIFILDEATSNIDTETEGLIQDTIKKVIRDKTTIAIAHRLSTIQNCDKIIVLHKGQIRETGNHQQLLQHKGIYYHLYQLQYKEDIDLAQN